MEGFEGGESAFVSKCLSGKFLLHRMILISKKNSAAPKTKRWLLNSSSFVDHTKSCPMKTNVPFRGIWIQFSWTNPQKFKFAEGCPRVRRGRGDVGASNWLTSWSFSALLLTEGFFVMQWPGNILQLHEVSSLVWFLTVYLQCKPVLGSSGLCGVTAWQYPLAPCTQWLRQVLMLIFLDRLLIFKKTTPVIQ